MLLSYRNSSNGSCGQSNYSEMRLLSAGGTALSDMQPSFVKLVLGLLAKIRQNWSRTQLKSVVHPLRLSGLSRGFLGCHSPFVGFA